VLEHGLELRLVDFADIFSQMVADFLQPDMVVGIAF
jgi:hypothetical protein